MYAFQSETHIREIQTWLNLKDRDHQPMPEPCEVVACSFCQAWYGHHFNQRRAVWAQRNEAATRPRLAAFRAANPRLFESIRA
jgi:hypothetical protein